MISGLIHKGSGIGNQLHRYVATRVLAMDRGLNFSMIGWENWKADFINIHPMDRFNQFDYSVEMPSGKTIAKSNWPLWEEKTNYYNPEFNFIEDNTIIDGEFQDERYFGHRLKEIDGWLKVEPAGVPDNLCIMGFRGGEFALYPELFLPFDYWVKAMEEMRAIDPSMRFRVVTDDPALAKEFFRGLEVEITHDLGLDWRQMRCAKYAIIANSSFYILPRLLAHALPLWEDFTERITIAPRYWARHNIKEWNMPQNFYKSFRYI